MVNEHYWTVLPYHAVRHFASLKLAPAGVVPQRERRPRQIVDYSYTDINQHTLPVAPYHAMQFGSALPRLLQRLVYSNPRHGPPLMCKIDLSDGYYRVPLTADASLQLAVILPPDQTTHNLIAIPLSLPMGWKESPPYFCAFTETVTDSTNHDLAADNPQYPTHPLLAASQAHPATQSSHFNPEAMLPIGQHDAPPLSYTDVYMDDFCLLAQTPLQTRTLNTVLHNIDAVFQDHAKSSRWQIISQSKIDKGDAAWSCHKRLLGWDIDTTRMTLTIPRHRHDKLLLHLADASLKIRISRKKWQQLLGELRSIALAIPSAKYLFSIMQHALVDQPGPRIRLNAMLQHSLTDWKHLLTSLLQPVSLHHLVPTAPTSIAACDASKDGMGEFVLPLTPQGTPMAWRAPFPPDLQQQLVSDSNKTGTTNNSHLELAAIVAATAQMLASTTTHHNTLLVASDNTPAVSWIQRGSTSTNAATAALLRLLHLFSRDRVFTLKAKHVPGKTNTIADFLSRSFHLSDDVVLDHLRTTTQQYWTLANPPTELAFIMNSMRCNKGSPTESPRLEPQPTTTCGTYGGPSVTPLMSIPTCKRSMTKFRPFNYLPNDIGRAAWLPAVLKSALEQWRQPFVPWARRWPQWGFGTHALHLPAPSTSGSNDYLPAMSATTQAQTVKNPSPYMSSSTLQQLSPRTRATGHTPSPTCYSSPTIFSCDQANTPSPTTPTQRRSASNTRISSAEIGGFTGQQPCHVTGQKSQKWHSNSIAKRTESAAKWSASHHLATTNGVPSKSSANGYRHSGSKAPLLTHPCTPTETHPINGQQSPQETLLPIFEQRPLPDTISTIPRPIHYPHDHCEPQGLWPSYAPGWNQRSSNCLVDGVPRKCYITCMFNRCL
jgi:hypothetical protein